MKEIKEGIEREIKEIQAEVSRHDELYALNKPIITDGEYDELYMKLERLEQEYPEVDSTNSPTRKIKTVIVSDLEKREHLTPMLSQQKINTEEGIKAFIESIKGDLLIQDKLDGISIVLRFNNGRLVSAVSRGNGEVGEDLTHNAIHFSNIPTVIPFKEELEVRGEAILPFKEFEKLNKDGRYSNPRNLVSGALRQLDSSNVKGKGFKVIIFDLVRVEGKEFQKDTDSIRFLDEQGFEMVESRVFSKEHPEEEVIDFVDDYEHNQRQHLDYMIDGLVLKTNDLNERLELGYTSKHPRWATAYKFDSLNATTTLTGVTGQVGKTGQITPVAEFETVTIDNVEINRATLHNYRNIRDKDIRVNDRIVVERANDVIPQVMQSIESERTGVEIEVEIPSHCPICNAITEQIGENLYCTGLDCAPQLEGKLKHFTSRDAMDISGLGDKTIEKFYNEGIINSVVDIYHLDKKEEKIKSLSGYGQKSYERIINGVKDSKNKELRNLIYGLAINNIGVSASRDLANEFKSLKEIIELSKSPNEFKKRITSIKDFGEIMAKSLLAFFQDSHNIEILEELIELGLTTEVAKNNVATDKTLEGTTFVITGRVNHFNNRKELKEKIEDLGGKVTGSVSGNTDYLINNDKESTTSKNKQAINLNVPIISEDEFLNLI